VKNETETEKYFAT